MIRHSLSLILSLLFFSVFAQGQSNNFLSTWLGTWTGDLNIYSEVNLVNTIPMSLEIKALDSTGWYKYYITYGEGEDALRPYVLKTIDEFRGHYVLDENNGISIEMFRVGNKLVSAFEVQNSFIQTNSFVQDSVLHYEILAGAMDPISITGDTVIGTDTIPPVKTFPFRVLQQAFLVRSD